MVWILRAIIPVALVAPISVHAQIATHAQAVERMAVDPDGAEAVLRKLEDTVGRLDLLLFLHAFRPASPTRDTEITRLKSALDKLALEETAKAPWEVEKRLTIMIPYDGGDESLIPTIRLLSATRLATTTPPFYAIPCAVLTRRPALLKATEPFPYFSFNKLLPRSGCRWGRGPVVGFPETLLAAFVEASLLADGNFLANHGGSNRYYLAAARYEYTEMARQNPQDLRPAPDHKARPYETWSYLSLANRHAFAIIMRAYDKVRAALTAYYIERGEPAASVEGLARRALFSVAFGVDCGEASPPRTLRTLLLNGASLADIAYEAGKAAVPHTKYSRLARNRRGSIR